MTARHLFFSPHPDDIALGCFASLVRVPPDVPRTLVTVFSQSCWEFILPVDSTRAFAVTTRRLEEDLRFARAHGADWVPLGLRDTSLRLPPGAEDRYPSEKDALRPAVEAALRPLLEAEAGAVCHVPLGISGHVDHLLVRDAVLALRGGARDVVFYEDLPYCERHGEAEISAFVRGLGLGLSPCLLDLTRDWPAKLRALGMYASQMEPKTIPAVERHARRLGAERGVAERVWKVVRE
jgi:LmbE family N-acetylglucosaminyl deacetylase